MQPIGERIQEIGVDDGGNEGQQDLRKERDDGNDDEERRQPEPELPLRAHDSSTPLRAGQ